jgi:threonyl-tRNA synthetase
MLSPGCGFWYPHGAKIYNKLVELIRNEYRVRGYNEVITPNMFNLKLWKTSGHYKNYKDNIYLFKIESQGFGMKPMNCPGHCLMFDSTVRSYRELPIRFGDFGVLHRNEITGALSGLTRVRRFQQDDAHIFCMPSQIMTEVLGVLDFLDHVYGIFGFQFELDLSTRPADKLGDDAMWDQAEAALAEALNKFGKPWKENPGDGAFYGPKIDIKVFDALKRPHQCGTVQLDFQLPIRFDLKYKTDQYEGTSEAHSSKTGEQSAHATPAEKSGEEESKKSNLRSEHYPKDELDEEDFTW